MKTGAAGTGVSQETLHLSLTLRGPASGGSCGGGCDAPMVTMATSAMSRVQGNSFLSQHSGADGIIIILRICNNTQSLLSIRCCLSEGGGRYR